MNTQQQDIINNIQRYGIHIQQVLGDDEFPQYCFSIGLYRKYKQPEVIIVGLNLETATDILNGLSDFLEEGGKLEIGKEYGDIIEGYSCKFNKVSEKWYEPLLGGALLFYQTERFPVLQLLWPDKNKNLPGSGDFNKELVWYQPVLE